MKKTAGVITLISGPMFAGKSDELIDEHNYIVQKYKLTPIEVLLVKPEMDKRNTKITSRNGKELDCILVEKPNDILPMITKSTKHVFIDEFQFFQMPLLPVIKSLKKKGISVTLAGLDKNFKRIDFPIFAELSDIADRQVTITARCQDCGRVAKYSRKLVNGIPAKRTSSTIEVDVNLSNDSVTYRAACSKCHK